jgi:murein DD-endopeptidase MepM/ murein hydrolase activator NlpD
MKSNKFSLGSELALNKPKFAHLLSRRVLMNRCKKFRALLALRPADLSLEEQQLVKRHLVACADCATLARSYAEQDRLIHHAPRVCLTPSQRGQLLSQIQQERRQYKITTKLSIILSSATAIMVLTALGLGVGALITTGQPTPDALPAPQVPVDAETPLTAPETTLTLVWPVEGHITQTYSDNHPALDIAAKEGDPVVAVAAGVVVFVGWDDVYGNNVVIDHGDGLRTFYSKLLDYQVEIGDEVTEGQQIGRVGSTGQATGPHLHFELHQNINPLPLLQGK